MKTPTEELLDEILPADDLRVASLEKMLIAVRRERRRRQITQYAAVLAICGVITAGMLWPHHRQEPRTVASMQSVPRTVPGTNIRLLSDAELLAMFPDRPVALIGPPEDRRFVFLDDPKAKAALQ